MKALLVVLALGIVLCCLVGSASARKRLAKKSTDDGCPFPGKQVAVFNRKHHGNCLVKCKRGSCKQDQKCCRTKCGGTGCMKVKSQVGRPCPKGVPIVMCYLNPCKLAKCPKIPKAKCMPYYCGGCQAKFYLGNKEVTSRCKGKPKRG